MNFFLIIGVIGMCMILYTFLMNQAGKLKNDDLAYDFWNAIGSFLLLAYSLAGHAWPFVVLNAVWLSYSLRDVIIDLQKQKTPPKRGNVVDVEASDVERNS